MPTKDWSRSQMDAMGCEPDGVANRKGNTECTKLENM